MTSKINREAYEKLIEDDLELLKRLPDNIVRHHIEQVLHWSVDALYPPDTWMEPLTAMSDESFMAITGILDKDEEFKRLPVASRMVLKNEVYSILKKVKK